MSYIDELQNEIDRLRAVLIDCGVSEEYLAFGEPGNTEKTPRPPTSATSEFLANRAMGDWAENILAQSIRDALPDKRIVHYGESDTIAAHEEGFKEFYIDRWKNTQTFGKRPDLLVMPNTIDCEEDVSHINVPDLTEVVKASDFSIEVRSSKFEALTYMKVRQEDFEKTGKKPQRMTPSFTVKVEDLLIVHRWILLHECPQIYCQVFFDSIYAINFLDIFKLIASGKSKFKIETPAKSQQKSTITIPITEGLRISNSVESPSFEAEHQVTRLGRHDAFVKPVGGAVELNPENLLFVALVAT